jgi:hypothetical protein
MVAAAIAIAAVGCTTGATPGTPIDRIAQGVAFDTHSRITEVDYGSRVGLTDDSVIPNSTLTATAASPVKILAAQAMSPSAGLRVLGFVAYRYSQTPGASSSHGPIKAPHRPLVGVAVTHATAYWWQIELQPEHVGVLSVHGIQITYTEAGKTYHQLLPVTYVMHVHPRR